MRARAPLALVIVAAVVAAGLVAGASADKPTQPQRLFRGLLLDDSRTTSAVKRLLRTGAGFTSAVPAFVDLTGDGREDAIVLVHTAGAADAVAAYVFSTHGAADPESAKLRAIFRSQSLYRAQARERSGALLIEMPVWKAGDDLCCPDKMSRSEYTWSEEAERMVRRAKTEYDLVTTPTS
jgi:hypothetical protein